MKSYEFTKEQQQIYWMDKFGEGSVAGVSANILRKGTCKEEVLVRSIQELLYRHDIFHLQVQETAEGPCQQFVPPEEISVPVLHFPHQADLQMWAQEDAKHEIAMSGYVYHVYGVITEHHFGIYIKLHHIICDAWTLDLVSDAFARIYHQCANGETVTTPYVSFASHLQNYRIDEKAYQRSRRFWEQQLEQCSSCVTLAHREGQHQTAVRHTEIVDAAAWQSITEFCKKYDITPYVLCLAALGILVSAMTQEHQFYIGTTLYNRIGAREKNTMGMFVDTSAVLLALDPEMSVLEMMDAAYDAAMETMKNGKFVYADVAALLAETYKSNSRLYEISLNYQVNTVKDRLDFQTEWFHCGNQTNALDIHMREIGSQMQIHYDYQTEKFDAFEIEYLHKHLLMVLKAMVQNPEQKLSEIPLITEEEQNTVLLAFNDTKTDYPKEKTVVQLLEEQVQCTPEHTALALAENRISYAELNKKANVLAHKLRAMGVKPNDFVAILAERQIEVVIGICAILKAGGAYLPIDASYPQERISYILEDSKPKAVLKYKAAVETPLPVIDLTEETVWCGNAENPELVNQPENLAYCIYTSGTTGQPKGVLVTHQNIIKLVKNCDYTVLDTESVILQTGQLAFDASTFELWGSFLNGGTMYMIEESDLLHVSSFKAYLADHKITTMFLTVALFNQMMDEDETVFRTMKHLLIGGEAVSERHVEMLRRQKTGLDFRNAYGPTETTTFASHYRITETHSRTPIGRPLSNTQLYIVNGGRPCGIGIPGELCIAGDGVAQGYLNRPELTAEKFIANPFGEGRMYRSGDLARWLPDGNVEYLGRIDQQVKIRGFRIELGEIESKIQEIPAIKSCAVIVREDQNGEKAIYAYYTSAEEFPAAAIREALSRSLPEYMIPPYMMQIDSLPMNRNGKLDKRALPEIRVKAEKSYVAPRNTEEAIICRIFKEILGAEQIGVKDSFFELGGHSLRATRLINQIEAETGVRIALKEIFTHATPEALAKLVEETEAESYEPIPQAEEKACYFMSSAQKRTYLIQQMQPESITYNMPYAMKLTGIVHAEALENALQTMICRHEILRTEFHMENGEPVQKIRNNAEADFVYVPESKETDAAWIEKFVKPFDLCHAPLVRIMLVNQGEYHLLLLDMHHIVGDGMSMNTFLRELSALYNGETLEPLTHQFKDYSEWMRTRDLSGQEAYWKEVFEEEPPVLDMPLDHPRPQKQNYDGAACKAQISSGLYTAIRRLSQKTGATEYMIFLAAAMVMLSKYSRQEDIVIGSPISGRTHKDTEGMLGMFVNTLAMRGRPEGNKTFAEFLTEVKEICLKAYEHQEYPFESLVEAVEVRRDLSRNPLFDVMLVLQNNEHSELTLNGLCIEEMNVESTVAKFDLSFNIANVQDTFIVTLEYSAALFQAETAQRMLMHYIELLEEAISDTNRKLKEIPMISEKEQNKIFGDFNNTMLKYPKEQTINDLFEKQVERYGDKPALLFGTERVTYGELNARANVIAHKLREMGVKPDDFVAIIAERSIEMIAGIYGIIKAGGAYVPMDPTYPEDRIQYMLEDCKPKAVLTYGAELETEIPVVDLCDPEVWKGNRENPEHVNTSDDLIYCIYTSGTTGKPKGVMNRHQGIVNLIYWMQATYPLREEDVILQKTTYVFDVSASEIFWWHLAGAALALSQKGAEKDPAAIAGEIEQYGVTVVDFVPSMLSMFLTMTKASMQQLRSLKYVLAAGEALNAELVRSFYEAMKGSGNTAVLGNIYGPTEASVYTTWYDCEPDFRRTGVPIGRPIANMQVYIANEGQLCGIGVPGELCIAGDGLARGYLNREELTAEKFVENPFGEGKMYRSGDLARWLPDGNIEYMGRIDQQVKIRGFRIELGEIESKIREIESVKECAVIAREDQSGDKAIYAYYTSDETITVSEIRENLKASLPDYMIPAYMMQIETIPVTRNGKLERRALPEITMKAEENYVAPRNEIETVVCDVFKAVLNVNQVGIRDSFFALGGDSIKAIRIVSKMREAGYDISMKSIMNGKTLEETAYTVTQTQQEIGEQGEITGTLQLTPIIKRYLRWNLKQPDYFNQAVILPLHPEDTIEQVQTVMAALIQHHDMLRLCGNKELYRIRSAAETETPVITILDLRQESDLWKATDQACTELQASLSLEDGELMKIAYIMAKTQNYVFWCLHHLAVDGVSWRILQEDFQTGLECLRKQQPITLPKKTASYPAWAQALQQHQSGFAFQNEKAYWKQEADEAIAGRFLGKTQTTETGYREKKLHFSKQITDQLLYEAGKSFNTEINDLLLTALGMAVRDVTGQEMITIGLEGHGREPLSVPIAIDRTVGWFTAMYPVILPCLEEMEAAILNTKDKLHKIPNHGIGFGFLEELWDAAEADIYFNYHGVLLQDAVSAERDMISIGQCSASENRLPGSMNLNGSIENGCLLFSVLYDSAQYTEETAEELARAYQNRLEAIVNYCVSKDEIVQTASDFTAEDLSMEDFAMIEDLL